MNTDDLIAALALDAPALPPRGIERRLLLWMIPAALITLCGVVFWLGLRPDLPAAVVGPTFWAKAAYTLALGGGGFWLLDRLGRPGSSARQPLILLGAVLILVAVLAIVELIALPAADRMSAMLGRSWQVCPRNILVLSVAAAPFVFFAARRFAPTRPMVAGAAAGLLTAGLAATLYGLHCPEHTAAFVAIWYTLGMALSAVAGAVVGRFVFRW
jgi:hypothetical protein